MVKVMGVVVLYYPPLATKHYIESYVGEVDKLVVVNNAGGSAVLDLLSSSDKIHVIATSENRGVAYALNQAAAYAVSHNYTWLLMMDQDSTFAPGGLKRLLQSAEDSPGTTGILSPRQALNNEKKKKYSRPLAAIRIAMTSGSMLNLAAWSACGPFDEKLFIDSIDHEYCLRLRKHGWKVIRDNVARLNHRPGKVVRHNWYLLTFHTSEHPASRHYFMTRNRMAVMARYWSFDPVYFLLESVEQFKALGKIVLLERDKCRKLLFTFQGFLHFLAGRYPHHA